MFAPLQNQNKSSEQMTATGILQFCLAMLLIPILDVFAKLLGQSLHPVEVSLMRFVIQTLLTVPLVIWAHQWQVPKGTLLMQFARGVLLAIATVFFFAALQHLPMAEAISIFFVQPLILTGLSAIFLGEKIRQRRIVAIIIGLVGVLIILQPSVVMFGLPALFPLAAAFSMAGYITITRKLAGKAHPYQMQFIVGLTATIVLGTTMLIGNIFEVTNMDFIIPDSQQIEWIIYMGLVATIGHILIVWAVNNAPASVLAPFQYTEIISTVILGYLVFGDLPAQSTIIGVSTIIGCGIYLFHRERVTAKAN
ncbi:DMT family transporter [Candidatus Puniceispirillum sp.]|nr:DMT family transporter [Candidatus Puniceispirillum sp.]